MGVGLIAEVGTGVAVLVGAGGTTEAGTGVEVLVGVGGTTEAGTGIAVLVGACGTTEAGIGIAALVDAGAGAGAGARPPLTSCVGHEPRYGPLVGGGAGTAADCFSCGDRFFWRRENIPGCCINEIWAC